MGRTAESARDERSDERCSGVDLNITAPDRMSLQIPFEPFPKIQPRMFGQVLLMRLFRDKGFLTQICRNNFMILRLAPPLVVSEEQIVCFNTRPGGPGALLHVCRSELPAGRVTGL
jgi:hypothetical protein